MAITKIHSITSTLDKAVGYICNREKTDEKLLVSGYGCEEYSAEFQFNLTKENHKATSKNLARHLIQSFSPGEVTPEQAHEIGMQLADELLQGEYEYIIATHVDRGHIHNHIIINEINFVNGKTFSTEHDQGKQGAWKQIRNISDKLCMENNLSVIKNAEHGLGKEYFEWLQSQNKCSWKDKLRAAIDDSILNAESYEDFLKKMTELGYEYKIKKDVPMFRAEGQTNFTSCSKKVLGWYYAPEQLQGRIERALHRRNAPVQNRNGFVQVQNPNEDNVGLQRWAMLKNMQELSEMVNTITELGCNSPSEIKEKLYSAHGERGMYNKEMNELSREIAAKELLLKNIKTYWNTKPIYDTYRKSANRKKYYNQHSEEIVLHKSSKEELKKIITGDTLPNTKALERDLENLKERKRAAEIGYDNAIKSAQKLEKAYSQYQEYISIQLNEQQKKSELE